MAAAVGAGTIIHHIHAPLLVIRRRRERRNQHLPPHDFYIDPDVLIGFCGLYEAPSAEDGTAIVSVGTDADNPRLDTH